MTSQGSAYGRFRRALDERSALQAIAAARELGTVALADALELVLLLRDAEPATFERAALRWHGRFCRETPGVGLDEAQAVLATLAALRGPRASQAGRALAELLYRRGLERACEVLGSWVASGRASI